MPGEEGGRAARTRRRDPWKTGVTAAAISLAVGALGFLIWALASPGQLAWLTSISNVLAAVLAAWTMAAAMLAWVIRARRAAAQQYPHLPSDASDQSTADAPHTARAAPYWATVDENMLVLRRRMPELLHRHQELKKVRDFATGRQGYLLLTGKAFAGKSALLYEAVQAVREGRWGETDVVCYFLSWRASDASDTRFLETVLPQLAQLRGTEMPKPTVDEYRRLWKLVAERAQRTGRHLLLVVDGLDEDTSEPGDRSVAELLPGLAGGWVHVLASSRPHPELPVNVPKGHPLREAAQVLLEPSPHAKEFADQATAELSQLANGSDLVVHILGLLAAASGPLSLEDLAALTVSDLCRPSALVIRKVRRVVEEQVARSLEFIGPAARKRYRFAHASLLDQARNHPDLGDPEYRELIHRWAGLWAAAGWPLPEAEGGGTPRYLLDTYPATLREEPGRLAALARHVGWIEAALISEGIDHVLADLRRAAFANPASAEVQAMLRTVTGQARNLRDRPVLRKPGYILRQLWMQAAEFGATALADQIQSRLRSAPEKPLLPLSMVSSALHAPSAELGRHGTYVDAMATLPGGHVVTAGKDGRILLWKSDTAVISPTELGRLEDRFRPRKMPLLGAFEHMVACFRAVAALPDKRIITLTAGGQVLVWDSSGHGSRPTELGQHKHAVNVAVLPDGRIVTFGGMHDGRALLWDPGNPGNSPAELGWHIRDHAERRMHPFGMISVMAVLPDGRVVTAGGDGWLLLWDPGDPGSSPTELGYDSRLVEAAAVLPDGRVVTAGHADGQVLVWDPGDPGRSPAAIGQYKQAMQAANVEMLPDNPVVIAGGGNLRSWDPRDPSDLGNWPASLLRDVRSGSVLAVLPDGRIVSAGLFGNEVLIWDPGDLGTGPTELGRDERRLHSAAVLPDGRIVTVGDSNRVLAWDPRGPGSSPAELGRHEPRVEKVAVLPDGRIVTAGWGNDRLLLWDPGDPINGPTEINSPAEPGQHQYGFHALAVLADGRIVTTTVDSQLLLWNPDSPGNSPTKLGWCGGHEVAVLHDGRILTHGVYGFDSGVLVWDPNAPGSRAAKLEGHEEGSPKLAVLPDGRIVIATHDKEVLIYNPENIREPEVQINCPVHSITVSQRGSFRPRLIISLINGGLSAWSLAADDHPHSVDSDLA